MEKTKKKSKRKNKAHGHFNPFKVAGEPNVKFDYEGKDLRIYFFDNYDFMEKALKNQIFHIHTEKDKFHIFLEKEAYDLVPELFTKEVLAAQCDYFQQTPTKIGAKRGITGLLIFIGGAALLSMLMLISTAIFISMFIASIYFIVVMIKGLQDGVTVRRKKLRADMITLLGEQKLDKLLDKQQNYAEHRMTELN